MVFSPEERYCIVFLEMKSNHEIKPLWVHDPVTPSQYALDEEDLEVSQASQQDDLLYKEYGEEQ